MANLYPGFGLELASSVSFDLRVGFVYEYWKNHKLRRLNRGCGQFIMDFLRKS